MPAVTDIRQQKRPGRYSIYIDRKYSFSLSEAQLLEEKLKIGLEVSPSDLARLGHLSELGKVLDRCYNLLSYRPRSEQELRDYLRRKGHEDLVDPALERLRGQGFVDDRKFASDWAEDRRRFGLRSQRHIQAELRQKGISREVADEILGELTDESEGDTISQLIQSRNLQTKYPDERKLIQYLRGKGFSYGNIKAALQRLNELES